MNDNLADNATPQTSKAPENTSEQAPTEQATPAVNPQLAPPPAPPAQASGETAAKPVQLDTPKQPAAAPSKDAPKEDATVRNMAAPELSDDMTAAADQAMAAATAVQPKSDKPAAESDGGQKPAKVRGPRVVESGREYREGVVVSVGETDVFVEFGPKSLGVVSRTQFTDQKTGMERGLPNPGEYLKVAVDRYESKESLYICSLPGVVVKADWELLEPGMVVDARCTGTNKGGLEMEVAKHRAFMPASQVADRRIEDLSVFVGESMTCKVMQIDRTGKGNITLSRREILDEERKERAEELKDKVTVGQTLEGTVRKIMPFGAFVDIGGIDGLVHVSDMSHDRRAKPENIVKVGEKIRVQILKLDWDTGRHALGMKQLQDDPFETSVSEIKDGDVVSGRVTKLLDFGAFVEISDGVEGLVHISELDWKRVNQVSDVIQPNQVVQVKVLKIDPQDRKISLSIKQTKDAPAAPKGGGGGRGGKGGGRGGERDERSPEEILKETPALRRMREQAAQRKHERPEKGGGGLGKAGGLGLGLGDLKL